MEWTAAQLGTLFPAVAAQMRGPLSNLGLAMQTLLPEEKRENAPDVDRTAARADQSYYALVRFLDNLSNVGWLTGNRKPRLQFCGIVRLVTDICVDCADLFEDQGRNLTFQVPPAERVYKVDQDAVRTAFYQLLSNALKFTPAGGWVRVELKTDQHGFRLSVSNSGEGIAADLLDFLSDRCEHPDRMDLPPHGLGLGLPLCRAIAEAHGGRLLVQSQTGVRCTVTLSIPMEESCVVADSAHLEYNAGFDPALLGLADALPSSAFRLTWGDSGTG